MIITRTPYRVSFFGGGSDFEPWYSKHGGAVLTSTIDSYCYVLARFMPPFLGTRYRIFWSKMETVNERSEIQHPAVRACLEYLGIDEGFEINHAGDLPARSGLGSSSAFTVGLLNALHALNGKLATKDQLALEAIHVEQRVMRETVGVQDQIQCAHGGLNLIELNRDGSHLVRPIILPSARSVELQSHLMLFFTGLQRDSSEIAAAQVANAERRENELHAIASMVPRAVAILTTGKPIEQFGNLLHESWLLKRTLSEKVSNSQLDAIYQTALGAGATGGKVLGAGGGGFFLFFAKPAAQEAVRRALDGLLEVPLRFEHSGTQIVHATR